jgi:small GTP-binding protein
MSEETQFLPAHAKAVLIGSMGVGKTALSSYAIFRVFDPIYQATVGVGYATYQTEITGHPVSMDLWDTAGMERYSSLGPIYYRGADAAIFVYDLTNPQTATEIETWYEAFVGAVGNPFYGVVVGNKLDLLPDADTEAMSAWAAEHRLGFLTTSAKTGHHVTALFDMAVQGAFLVKNTDVFERPSPVQAGDRRCCS